MERLGQMLAGSLELKSILGTGSYGVVYLATDVNTGTRYAVKCLNKFYADGSRLDASQLLNYHREIQLHRQASAHPNVVDIHKFLDRPEGIYVVIEYCEEGDLFLNITQRGLYVGNDVLSKSIFLQIIDALEYCHKCNIYHHDLKPENILVFNNGQTVKLADFGFATTNATSDYGTRGSMAYMSPECLDCGTREVHHHMSAPSDIWSLGIILVNLTCGLSPWGQASIEDLTYRAYTANYHLLTSILPLSDDLNNILRRIFNPNPRYRITLPELRDRIVACPSFTKPKEKYDRALLAA
ncbi:Serine/threonine protein kinase [Metarhizium acridum]|nr:Serine/threonine protein kinase [Metarhizium acridum]